VRPHILRIADGVLLGVPLDGQPFNDRGDLALDEVGRVRARHLARRVRSSSMRPTFPPEGERGAALHEVRAEGLPTPTILITAVDQRPSRRRCDLVVASRPRLQSMRRRYAVRLSPESARGCCFRTSNVTSCRHAPTLLGSRARATSAVRSCYGSAGAHRGDRAPSLFT
jgi:hypothetical protein